MLGGVAGQSAEASYSRDPGAEKATCHGPVQAFETDGDFPKLLRRRRSSCELNVSPSPDSSQY